METDELSNGQFWELIRLLQGRVTDASLERLKRELATRPPSQIIGFADRLAEALHRLDRRELARQPVRHLDGGGASHQPIPLSDDAFLYARCAVVAAGEEMYRRVDSDPASFAGAWDLHDAESLLYAAEEVYEEVTGEEWDHEEPVSYESGSNKAGWD